MSRAQTLETWVAQFKKEIVPPDAEEVVVRAFLHHLADLSVFQIGDGSRWSLAGLDSADILNHLEKLSATQKGFAVGYFLASRTETSRLDEITTPLADLPSPAASRRDSDFKKKSADLSNLQIVRKTAASLQPFLDLEKSWLDKLTGPNTGKEDARKLFNYILSKTRTKAQPLKWQQLSRRRHKKSLPE